MKDFIFYFLFLISYSSTMCVVWLSFLRVFGHVSSFFAKQIVDRNLLDIQPVGCERWGWEYLISMFIRGQLSIAFQFPLCVSIKDYSYEYSSGKWTITCYTLLALNSSIGPGTPVNMVVAGNKCANLFCYPLFHEDLTFPNTCNLPQTTKENMEVKCPISCASHIYEPEMILFKCFLIKYLWAHILAICRYFSLLPAAVITM